MGGGKGATRRSFARLPWAKFAADSSLKLYCLKLKWRLLSMPASGQWQTSGFRWALHMTKEGLRRI